MAVFSHAAALSLLSGLLAASAGLLAKLGLDQDQLTDLHIWPVLVVSIRFGLVGLTLLLNCCMLTIYSRALSLSPTAAEASLLNTAANLVTTAAAGAAVLGEELSAQWWAGAVLIAAGSWLVISDKNKTD